MKIKRFKENIKNSPEIGDYIIGEVNYPEDFKPTENLINNSMDK